MDPSTPIQYLKGVGPARAGLYAKLGIHTLRDLLYHFPRSYIDLSAPTPAAECPAGDTCAVRAAVLRKLPPARLRGGLTLYKLIVADDSGEMNVTLFNTKYAFDSLREGEEYVFYGRVGGGSRPEMASPSIFPAESASPLMPVYPLTAGLTSKILSQNVRQALSAVGESLSDPLPAALRERCGLSILPWSMENIHFPAGGHALRLARNRFIFEELFNLTLALRQMRARAQVHTEVRIAPFSPEEFYAALPFTPTGAQRRAVEEILADLCGDAPMNRLLQGDVGSGKTLVAAAACLACVKAGYQCAVMVPTDILAQQHYDTFTRLLSPLGVRTALLTGSLRTKERRMVLDEIETGLCGVAVGTQSLISGGVQFRRLGLTVTDEQHRFGVGQRVSLQEKSLAPHVLVMSATPIPRTLALIIYGDLDLSILDELPRGRVPVNTYCISTAKLQRAWGFVRGLLDEGRQAYVVCPLVSDEEAVIPGLQSVEKLCGELSQGPFSAYSVGLLHGKQKPAEKDAVMRRFKNGEIQLLVCTTVIEVGVDVPNAAALVCMNAERFGLSQLHQLRGRVGRGQYASTCILVSDARGGTARERLSAMCATQDGFKIAESDLKLRGPGDFFGGRQHGLPEMHIADLAEDVDALGLAQRAALELLEEDPALSKPENTPLRESCERIISSVGGRPN